MSTNARVYVEIKGKFAHLFFDQPTARNAMTQEMYEQLRTICLELNQNFQIRVVILPSSPRFRMVKMGCGTRS